jgi:UDP-glucose 4-epimerase
MLSRPPGARPILVTGGAGFIGSHVVERLVAGGEPVVVLDDLSAGDAALVPEGVRLVEADVANPGVRDLIVDLEPRAIIHAAAQISVPRSVTEPGRDRAVNVGGTEHLIAAARECREVRVVYLSSGGGIYGNTLEPATEDTQPQPMSPYSHHKLAAEECLTQSGLPHAIARLANVYGPRQRAGQEGAVAAIFAERLQHGLPITIHGDGEQSRDFVHVSDVVDALVLMLRSPMNGIWNVGSGTPVTINALLSAAERVFGPAVGVNHAPARAGDVRDSALNVEKIARELGWQAQVGLDAGMQTLHSRG